jgi:predicted CoA-substrate-specific enzyme activase
MKKFVLGIDMGSAYSKGILMRDREILAAYSCPSGGALKLAAEKIRLELLSGSDLKDHELCYTVTTGFGAKKVSFADASMSDVSCQARGVFHLFPSVRTVVDVGDLYSKALRMDGDGNLLSFLLSGKCAGGSARALTVIAKVLQLRVEDMGELSLKSGKRVEFNTGCAVFAESEAVSRIAEGVAKEDLLAGLHRALAAQLNALAERLGIEKDYALVGGAAKNIGLVKALEEINHFEIIVPPDPQITGALGAALIGTDTLRIT